MNEQPKGPEAIMQMMWAGHASAIVGAGIETGAFAALGGGPLELGAVAEKMKCPTRSTRILLDALVGLGLAKRDGAKYALAPHAADHLVPGKPMYVGDINGILGNKIMWSGLMRLGDAVRAGGSVQESHAEVAENPFWESFAQSSASMAFPASEAIEANLHDFLSTRKDASLLDVAAGSGIYGYTFAKKNPKLDVTLLDWPNVIPHTKTWADRLGVDAKGVKYIVGDLFKVDYKGPYDVVLLSHVFHHFDPPTCAALMKKAAAATKPGGRVVIHDFLADDANPMSRMFAITMLMWTKKGEAYARTDYDAWLKEAGLASASLVAMPGMPTSVLIATKG